MDMKKAEMEVVRFTESDVIVASTLGIYNFNDGDHSTGIMTYRGQTYNYGNDSDLISRLPSDKVHTTTGATYGIDDMFWEELNPSSMYNVATEDGEYVFDSIQGYWKHQ